RIAAPPVAQRRACSRQVARERAAVEHPGVLPGLRRETRPADVARREGSRAHLVISGDRGDPRRDDADQLCREAHATMMRWIASSPSNSAAGPGCRMI